MSKKGKTPNLGKTASKKTSAISAAQSKPSTSRTESKELYSYTPNWITPQEKARLKARVQQIKLKENRLSLNKEDVVLLHAAEKKGSQASEISEHASESGSSKDKKAMKKTKSTESPPSTKDKELKKTKSDKSVKSDKSAGDQNSKEIVNKTKSKDSVKSSKSGKSDKSEKSDKSAKSDKSHRSDKSDKGKSKEDLRMSKKNEEKGKHPKEAHANPSGNTMESRPQREISKGELNEHLWATDYAQFDPQVYHFKSPEKLSTKNPVLAECPPFWVLLDHTIAVTWKLFCANAERKDLGIISLQWSREFVSAMRDERGEYLPATGQLLGAIEDALIDRYAKAADANDCVEKEKDDGEAGTCKKGKGDCKKEQDSLSYVSSENIFKYPVEVSYTLKDIMSRNMPGRKHADGEDSVRGIEDPAVSKVDILPPEDHETMSKSDMLHYLKQLKQEQELRVEKEKEHAHKIETLLELLAKGKTRNDPFEGYDSKKKKEHDAEHVHFDGDEEDEMKHEKSDADMGEGGKSSKGKGGKVKGKEKEGRKDKEVKKEKSEEDQKKKKKMVSMENNQETEEKGSKKGSR